VCDHIISFFLNAFWGKKCVEVNVGQTILKFSKHFNTASNNCYLKYKSCSHTLSILWICWKTIAGEFLYSCLVIAKLKIFLKSYLKEYILYCLNLLMVLDLKLLIFIVA